MRKIPQFFDSRKFQTRVSRAGFPVGIPGDRCSLICQWLLDLWSSHLTTMSTPVRPQEEGGDHAHTQSLYSPGREALAEHQRCNRDNLQCSVWGNQSFPLRCPGFLCAECVTGVSPTPPDPDRASVHAGSSQNSSWSRLHCQDSEPK